MVSEPCPNLAMSIEFSIAHDLNMLKQITEAEEQLEGRELFNRGALSTYALLILLFFFLFFFFFFFCTEPYVQIT